MALATVAPAPGRMPTTKPTSDERTVPHQVSATSRRLNSVRPVSGMTALPWTASSSISSSSLMENRPITTTMN